MKSSCVDVSASLHLSHSFLIYPPSFFILQVLDSSRDDWWLVASTENSSAVGWVPANYLEKLLRVQSPSPAPEVFDDEMDELRGILMK